MAKRYVRVGGQAVHLDPRPVSDQMPNGILGNGVSAAGSVRNGTSATGHATPFSDGAYVDIDTALSADAAGVWVHVGAATATGDTDTSTYLEIATGSPGSEVPWASVPVGYRTAQQQVYVPGFIASGSRVRVRVRSAVSSKEVAAVYTFLPVIDGNAPGTPVTMGADPATARGVTITAPGSTNTKGAWTEIEDSVPKDLSLLYVGPQAAGDSGLSSSGVLVDIGKGPDDSNVTIIIPDLYLAFSSSEWIASNCPLTYGVEIEQGDGLFARYARNNAGNSLDLTLIAA